MHFDCPLEVPRPPGARRIEAWSPRLKRRLTLYSRAAYELWVSIESDPAVRAFCERPARLAGANGSEVAEFWVRKDRRDEFLLLGAPAARDPERFVLLEDERVVRVRRVVPADLLAARTWVLNWQQILPYLAANLRFATPALLAEVKAALASPRSLMALERRFREQDAMIVRTALFALLHAGAVRAPSLHTKPLSLHTTFHRAETAA
jgi:hypothetical protein